MLDLGANGKGYALERAVGLLREVSAARRFNGGTSTIYGLGRPPSAVAWKVAVEYLTERKPGIPPSFLAAVPLCDYAALSVSAVWGYRLKRKAKLLDTFLIRALVSRSPTRCWPRWRWRPARKRTRFPPFRLIAGESGYEPILVCDRKCGRC